MAKDVRRFVKACHFCQATKAPKSYPVAPLRRLNPGGVMVLLTFDLIGPLSLTARGNQYILSLICHFSKYAKSYPLSNKEAKKVANIIIEHILTFGIPEAALSDQATEFQSAVLRVCGKCSMYISIEHPRIILN